MLWLPDDGSQLGLYVPLGLLETGVGVGLKIVFWIGDIPEEKKYELLFNIYIREPVKKKMWKIFKKKKKLKKVLKTLKSPK